MKTLSDTTVDDRFFAPLEKALETATKSRDCKRFQDRQFLRAGVGRCLNLVRSGRDWVQQLQSLFALPITVDNFFTALRSERRLALLSEVNEAVVADCAANPVADPFAAHEELRDFALYAADGHYHACSTHEAPILGKRRPTGHFFALNLRSLALRHLDITRADEATGRKTEHDLHVLKRLPTAALRMNEPTGTKVLIAYDRAVIDFVQWHKWKQGSGIYILTREKENMALQIIGENDIDRADPRNRGVVADQTVGHSKGRCVRRVIYTDPVGGETYRFITNQLTFPPGLIAYLYKCRWDLEKVFDELKNKLVEGKAWGKTDTAKCLQGHFLCLTHNLLVLLENTLQIEEDITDDKVRRRRADRAAAQAARAEAAGSPINPLLTAARRATQRSLQFLRWLRHVLLVPTPWRAAIDRLRPLMMNYLN